MVTKRTNSVHLTAQILAMKSQRTSWESVTGQLEVTSGFLIEFFVTGRALRTLKEYFKVGDFVEVKGHLSKAPNGTLQITVSNIQPARLMGESVTLTHHMQIPQVAAP